MSSFKIFVGSITAAVAPPVLLTILAVAFQKEIGLYYNNPIPLDTLLNYVFLIDVKAMQTNSLIAVIISWILAGLFIGEVTRKLIYGLASSIVGYFLLVFYYVFSLETIPAIFTLPSIYTFITLLGSAAIFSGIREMRKPKPFFTRLEEGGVKVEEEYKYPLKLPIKCPNCNAVIYSNSEYCWNCNFRLVDLFPRFRES